MDLNYLKPLLEEKLSSMGYELYSLTQHREKEHLVLSLVVDKVEAIDMNEIVKVSESISSYLDEIDTSEDKYLLDISSLGAEKPLKVDDLPKYVGRYINVHVNNAVDGENIFEGTLARCDEHEIEVVYRIKTRVKKVVILLSNIYKIRLAIKF